jgi:hypothetical protein
MATRLAVRTIVVSGVLLVLATPSAVDAAYTSTVSGSSATMTGDGASDTLSITHEGGLFRHNRFTAGDPLFSSDFDFNTAVAGDQVVVSDSGIININAGGGNDSIALGNGVDLRGAIDGGPGTADLIDYSAYTTGIAANLGLGTTGLSATLAGNQEVPPTIHAGTGTATITNYSVTTRTFDISVAVSDLAAADVTGFHIHHAAVGVNGLIIVDFGVAGLVPSGNGFTFNAIGVPLPDIHEASFLGGVTYVNIHTPTLPGGAIRGQLFSTGNVILASGEATGASSVTGIENVTGGTSDDSLVGNSTVNSLIGASGADRIVGGGANDILFGDVGADVIVWSNGDGTDVVEGGADGDTVQINGSVTAADVFTVSAGVGGRIDFDRISPGPFSLDIGTAETLIVNGIVGDDSVIVNALTGVVHLTTLNLNGFDGNDTFTYVPTSAGAFVFSAHGGSGTDTLQGPTGATTWNVTAANEGNIAGLVTAFSFVESLSGGGADDTFNVRAFATGPLTVTGGAGTDTLNYDAESRTISGDTSAPDGVIDSPGVQSVTFTHIEMVNIINSTTFTDPTLTPGVTPIRAVHINELRTRVNTVRAARGLGAASFSDSPLSVGVTPIRAVHVLELRAALAEAYVAAGRTPPSYADPVPAEGVVVMAAAITELRAAVIAIE